MKKIFLYILAGSLCFSACKKDDDDVATYVEPEDITTQNTYDDQSIQKFLNDNYLDAQGNVKSFSSTITTDDNEVKLINLNPQTLPSGVIYIERVGAQPSPGTTIGATDIVRLMMRARTYLAGNTDGETKFLTAEQFVNYSPLDGDGSPKVDPMFYHVTDAKMAQYCAAWWMARAPVITRARPHSAAPRSRSIFMSGWVLRAGSWRRGRGQRVPRARAGGAGGARCAAGAHGCARWPLRRRAPDR